MTFSHVLHKFGKRFGIKRRPYDDEALTAAVDQKLNRLRNVDPETQQHWLMLQRAIGQSEGKRQRTSFGIVPRLALGSVVAAAVVAYFFLYPRQLPTETFVTEKGQQTRLVLQDSSEVTLNYTSELVVPALRQGKPRLLSLKGEAYFHVRRNNTPFIVSTGYAEVRVVGTEFNVRSRNGKLEVAVIHGTVTVNVGRNGEDSTLVLSANQMAVCSLDGFPERTGNIPSSEYPGWMHGKLFLSGTSFAMACREIEMRFGVVIGVEDQHLRDEVITGTLEARTAASALTALCNLTGRTFRNDSQKFTVY